MKRAIAFLLLILCPFVVLADSPVIDLPYSKIAPAPGFEERGQGFAKWLAPCVRIGGASGTMVHFDGEYAYVLSAGHLFGKGYSKDDRSVNVEVFYEGYKKLSRPKVYKAQLLCKVWGSGISSVYDVSLLRFKPDWIEVGWQCMPIAAENYQLSVGQTYHSVGCDGMSEPAHYLVEFTEERNNGGVTELVTKKNGPRGGRSGGGTFSDDGYLVMVCSRGDGYLGIWTSLNQIHKFLKDEGYEYVLRNVIQARNILIVDMLRPQKRYPAEYIPIPGR